MTTSAYDASDDEQRQRLLVDAATNVKQKRLPCRRMADKECRICGDRSVGFNFDVVTCESCKAFFRRNARRPLTDFRCAYANNCTITKESRRFCKRCRLVKCFTVGMNKDALPPEDSLYHPSRKKLATNADDQTAGPSDIKVNKLEAQEHIDDSLPTIPVSQRNQLLQSPPHPPQNLRCTCTCALHNPVYYAMKHHQKLEAESELSAVTINANQRSLLLSALANNTQTSTGQANNDDWPPVLTGTYDTDQRQKLLELCSAGRIILTNFEHDHLTDCGVMTPVSFLYIMDKLTRKMIDMMKSVTAYRILHTQDQVTLLKAGIGEYHILRALMNYDIDKEQFTPHQRADYYYVRMESVKDVSWPLYIIMQRYCATFDPTWASNRLLMLLLMQIAIFNPSRQGLLEQEKVAGIHFDYKMLLQRYLHNSCMNASQAKYMQNALNNKTDELRTINETLLSYVANLNQQELGPVLTHFFQTTVSNTSSSVSFTQSLFGDGQH